MQLPLRTVCGDRFAMADVYVGSQIDWGLRFGTLPDKPQFHDYMARLRQRTAYQRTQKDATALTGD